MDPNASWQRVLSLIQKQVSAPNFKTWFGSVVLKEVRENDVLILIPSAFVKDQLQTRYQDLIKTSLKEVLGKEYSIEYQIDPNLAYKKQAKEPEEIFQMPAQRTTNFTTLNPKFTLENFVVGFTNNLAYAAAQAVSQAPGTSYNPLFIYGPSGVGKTHLMQGVGNTALKLNPGLKIIYASSERFMNDFVDSIQNKKTYDFRQRYRSCDILLIDDIQFISGKDSTQEEFFHTFNELQSRNCQIILTSDRPPNEMLKLESRLVSRFQGGLMVDIQRPDFDTRVAILKAKLLEKQGSLPEEIINAIAQYTESNTRELEGKLTQILEIVKLSKVEPTLELVKKSLGQPQSSVSIDHKKVISQINLYFNVKTADLIGPRRQKELVLPRQIAMFLMYEECRLPMEKIGEILGGRDHTTVLHGIEKIKEVATKDLDLKRIVGELRQQLTS